VLTLTIAFRTLVKRKGRMALIAVLVGFGTFLIVFGGMFASSVARESRASIIGNFTGDFIVYADRSKSLPSPFAFSTPLPNIRDVAKVSEALDSIGGIESYARYSQNYGLIQVERDGKKLDLPFIFYAVEPESYRSVFSNVRMENGSFFSVPDPAPAGSTSPDAATAAGATAAGATAPSATAVGVSSGIVISEYQNEQYKKNYGVTLEVGESVTLLGVTEGGVNTLRSSLLGIFEPVSYRSVFDYINYMDSTTYSGLYNFTGVQGLPDEFNDALAAANVDESSLFDLGADDAFGRIDLGSLSSETLSGFTMIAVKLKDHGRIDEVVAELLAVPGLGIKVAKWDKASGFYAQISSALQAFIFLATGLIFLVVTLIFMNTLIINVVERTAEIGTMRALGADKSFVRGVFLTETLILNVTAALGAMVVSAVLLLLVSRTGLPLPETISQFLIGGGSLRMTVEPMPFLAALFTVVVVSVLATVYPVSVATAITPLKAMNDR
jgi:putative ABC transport system permease protein